MFYLVYGTAVEKTLDEFKRLTGEIANKNKLSVFRVDAISFDQAVFEEYLHGQLLFGEKYLVAGNSLFENAEAKDFILKHAEEIAGSPNIFVFREAGLTANDRKTLEEHAHESKNYDAVKRKPDFNIFLLTDTLARRDRKELWVIVQRAHLASISSEEIFWKFVWQIKNMLIVSKEKGDATSLGMNPYVYQKTASGAKRFSVPELESFSEDLVALYHNARTGKVDFDIGLERFVFSI